MSIATTTPRLWGEWQPQYYGSGTTIVVLREYQYKPHLYVYADRGIDEDRQQSDRFPMCQQLADFLNGGERPVWLDDLMRVDETRLEGLSGASIHAVGPMYDCDPPKLHWIQDDSEDCANDRARLIDAIHLTTKGTT
jgi:hypothetical protein